MLTLISKKIAPIALVLGSALPVVALAGENGSAYTTISTGGVGVGYAISATNDWAVRGEFNGLPSKNLSGDSNLNVNLEWNTVNLLGDWYPTDSSFRVTGGVLFNNSKVTITGKGDVDGAAATAINSVIKVSDGLTPYLGIGYGTRPQNAKGWGFVFDLGVAFNNPTVSLTATGVTAAKIAKAKKDIEDNLKTLQMMPVFGIGISYSF